MAMRLYPTGRVKTDGDVAFSAMERPLSPWATLGQSAADAAINTYGLGSMIREGSTPDVAKTPVAGGRGGVQWRFEDEAEVKARGDTLFSTQNDYKASPYYREEIPFERGMTESRAKALAEMQDTSRVRQFYGSKRPVTAFVGALAGSALDPINYIPIVGEAAYAAAAARVGRIASRSLLTGADAALNTAIFGVATADQRARLGDDVSWSAIGMNAAFAAMAGATLGGAFGAVTRGPNINIPRADVPRADVPAVARIDLPETMRTEGVATGQLEPVRTVAADPVLRLETAENRIKSAEVLNDAIDGLVTRGEVALGERSRATIAEMRAAADLRINDLRNEILQGPETASDIVHVRVDGDYAHDAGTKDNGAPDYRWHPAQAGAKPMLRSEAQKLASAITRKNPGAKIEIERSSISPPPGRPVGSAADVLPADMRARFADGPRRPASDLSPDSLRSDALKGPEVERLVTRDSFYIPKPDLPPDGIAPAQAKIDANPNPDADPEQAAIDRAVADAKEEGFDPETGEHDLEPDIESLRNQEFLTAEEETALAAADETFAAVEAWEKTMNAIRTCALRNAS